MDFGFSSLFFQLFVPSFWNPFYLLFVLHIPIRMIIFFFLNSVSLDLLQHIQEEDNELIIMLSAY